MLVREFNESFWSYYLMLENDFIKTLEYVELDKRNFSSFSKTYVMLFLAICSEVDVVLKFYVHQFVRRETKNIHQHAAVILLHRPEIKDKEITISGRKGITLYPWKEWSANPNGKARFKDDLNVSPSWWKEHTEIKHSRIQVIDNSSNIRLANLGNVLNALAGLFQIEMMLYLEIAKANGENEILQPQKQSKLFRINQWVPYTEVKYGNLSLKDIEDETRD